MISKETYKDYFNNLLLGNSRECKRIVSELLAENIDLKLLYVELFQKKFI